MECTVAMQGMGARTWPRQLVLCSYLQEVAVADIYTCRRSMLDLEPSGMLAAINLAPAYADPVAGTGTRSRTSIYLPTMRLSRTWYWEPTPVRR